MVTQQQIDDYLKGNFPGGSVSYAARVLGISKYSVRCRIIYLKIDANMIFETLKYFDNE